jgi:hypothetical protein
MNGCSQRSVKHVWALMCSLSLLVVTAAADRCPEPHNTIFASELGSFGLKILLTPKSDAERKRESAEKPQGERQFWHTKATLFRLNDKGEEVVHWSKPLAYIPDRMLISERAEVVGIDEYCRRGFRHALVVLGTDGNVLADYRLEDLLSSDEIESNVKSTVSSRRWMLNGRAAFERPGFFVIRLDWGKVITVHLETGTIWPGFDPADYTTDAAFDEAVKAYRTKLGR